VESGMQNGSQYNKLPVNKDERDELRQEKMNFTLLASQSVSGVKGCFLENAVQCLKPCKPVQERITGDFLPKVR
jgi:hypothetical protein